MAVVNEIHVGDIGTIFRVTVKDSGSAVDLSGATIKQIKLRKPSGTVTAYDATFYSDGTDGIIQYTTLVDDLDEGGTWKLQVYLNIPLWIGHSDIQRFRVYPNLN